MKKEDGILKAKVVKKDASASNRVSTEKKT